MALGVTPLTASRRMRTGARLARIGCVNDNVVQGVGVVTIPSTGEVVGQYAYEAEFEDGLELPASLQVDVPIAVAVRCQSAGLSMELEIEDGRRVVFVVTAVGPGGAELAVVATRGGPPP